MCYNCGCFNPDDDMGSELNITHQTLQNLAKHWNKSLQESQLMLLNLLQSNDPSLETDPFLSKLFIQAAKAWGQSLDEAKKNTQILLKSELNR